MTGRDVLHLESILEGSDDFRNGVIRRDNQVEAVDDQLDLGIYRCGRRANFDRQADDRNS